MKVVKTKEADGHVQLELTASTAEVSEVLNQASAMFCNQNNLQPVPGKTPAQVANERLGIRDLDSVVAEQAIEMLVPMALDKQRITPACSPVPQPQSRLQRGHAFKMTLDVILKPAMELEDYGPVKLTMVPFEPDEGLVDNQISEMARQYVTYVADSPHPLHSGDSGLLKIAVTKDGEPVKNLTSEGRTFTLGQGFMPPSFEEALEGIEVGETRTFTFTGPDVDENMQAVEETYEATATLLEAQKKAIPVIDDEWVSKNMPMYGSLEELRADIRKNVNAERLRGYEDYQRNTATDELAKRLVGRISDEIYEGTMVETQTKLRQRVRAQGMTWDSFVEQNGGEQQLNMMMMLDVRQQLTRGFALDAYYRHEGLTFTEQDLDEVCFTMNPRNPKVTRERMEKSGFGYALREAAERLRACKHLVEHADITYKEAKDATS